MAQKRIDEVINEIAYPSIERCIRVRARVYTTVLLCCGRLCRYVSTVGRKSLRVACALPRVSQPFRRF